MLDMLVVGRHGWISVKQEGLLDHEWRLTPVRYMRNGGGMPRKKKTRKAAKKTSKKPASKRQSKTAFVLAQPGTMSAKDIVAAAKKAGMTLSTAYVYNIRGSAKKPGKKAGRTRALKAASKSAASDDLAFKQMVLDIGIKRARQLMADVERDFAALAGGS